MTTLHNFLQLTAVTAFVVMAIALINMVAK